MSNLLGSVGQWAFQNQVEKQVNALTGQLNDAIGGMINGAIGKAQTPLTDFLDKYGMLKGIFPQQVLRYEFNKFKEGDDDGQLVVYLPHVLEGKFSDGTVLRWDKEVTGTLRALKLFDISGIKFKNIMWTPVREIRIDIEENQVYFYGMTKKPRDLEAFQGPVEGIEVGSF